MNNSKMDDVLAALENAAVDLETFPTDEGFSYLIAGRLRRLKEQLETFSARDLIYIERNEP